MRLLFIVRRGGKEEGGAAPLWKEALLFHPRTQQQRTRQLFAAAPDLAAIAAETHRLCLVQGLAPDDHGAAREGGRPGFGGAAFEEE